MDSYSLLCRTILSDVGAHTSDAVAPAVRAYLLVPVDQTLLVGGIVFVAASSLVFLDILECVRNSRR